MSVPKKFTSIEQTLSISSSNVFFQRNEDMFKRLVDFMFSHKEPTRLMKAEDLQLLEWIIEMTPKLNDPSFNYNLSTRVHWVLLGLEDFPECASPDCNNKIGIGYNAVWCRGYVPYCSLKCGTKCSREKSNTTLHRHATEEKDFFCKIEQKKKKTRLERHGDPNWNNRESAFKTCLERLGTKCPIGNKDVLAKSLKTREKKYGKGNLTNYKKTAETCMQRYGHRSAWGNPDIHKKCIDKTIELHGSPNPGNKYELDGFKFDSKPELAFYIWLRDNCIEFTCKPDLSFEYEHEGQTYRYFPDFIVEGHVVEIKGDHFFEDCDPSKKMINPFLEVQDGQIEAKHQCMIEHDVDIITSARYSKYVSYVDDTYGKAFLDNCKKSKQLKQLA